MKSLLFSTSLLLLCIIGCAKYMDNPQPQDSTAMQDSALIKASKVITKERLVGVWLTKRGTGEEGFYLAADGKVTMQNVYSMTGERWDFFGGDSLRVIMKGSSSPIEKIYTITSLTDSVMTLLPLGTTTEEVYRKKANRHYEFTAQHQEFRGALQASQVLSHSFDVKTIFDGVLTLTSDNKNAAFTLEKDGNDITDAETRLWQGTFAPGKYTINVKGGRVAFKGAPKEYIIALEEKEIEK